MSEKLQEKVFDQFISVPGCRLTKTALIFDTIDESTLINAGACLQTTEGCRAWWWGDFLNAWCEWQLSQEDEKTKRDARIDPEYRERCWVYYTGRYAEIAGVESGTLRDWRQMAAFYKAGCRQPILSWAHHWEARAGAGGDLAVAQDWLGQAVANDWSKTDLRAAIRAKRKLDRGEEDEHPIPKHTHMEEVVACNRWSRMQLNRIGDMEKEEAQFWLNELTPTAKFIAALNERLALAGPS